MTELYLPIILIIFCVITLGGVIYAAFSGDEATNAFEKIIRDQERELSRLRHRIDELEKKARVEEIGRLNR